MGPARFCLTFHLPGKGGEAATEMAHGHPSRLPYPARMLQVPHKARGLPTHQAIY